MLNYEELERELKKMKPRQKLFKIVKAEVQERGHWKEKPRGVGFRKGDDPRRGDVLKRDTPSKTSHTSDK